MAKEKKTKTKTKTVTLILKQLASYSDGTKNSYRKGVRYAVEAKTAEVLLATGHFNKVEQKGEKDEDA